MNSREANLLIDWCSYEAARYAVVHWHYSGTMPLGKLVRLGVWENGKYIGVIIFARGASPYLGTKYGLKITEICELTRVALREHHNQVTRMIAIAVRMLRKGNPGLRLIVSFADANKGHVGMIYQGGNWIYTGKTKRKREYIDKNGRIWHDRQVTTSGRAEQFGRVRECQRPQDLQERELEGKHRYLMPLDNEMRAQIELLRQPYPKKGVTSIDSDAAGNQPVEGGAIPTVALQE